MADDLDWARRLVDSHAWVLHVETRTVGQVAELYDGEGKLYVPPGQERGTKAPVIRLEQGHTFLAKAGGFIELADKEALFLRDVQGAIAGCLAACAGRGAELAVLPQTGAMILAAALRAQLRELERLHPGVAPPGRGAA